MPHNANDRGADAALFWMLGSFANARWIMGWATTREDGSSYGPRYLPGGSIWASCRQSSAPLGSGRSCLITRRLGCPVWSSGVGLDAEPEQTSPTVFNREQEQVAVTRHRDDEDDGIGQKDIVSTPPHLLRSPKRPAVLR